VLESILSRLSESFDCALFGVNYRGPGLERGFRVIPNGLIGDPYGRDQLPSLLEDLAPDIVLIHHDPAMYSVHRETLVAYRQRRPRARVVVYCPIEWSSMDPGTLQTMADADAVVLYTHAGRATFEQAFAGAHTKQPPLAVIGHGVDETFRPLDPGFSRKPGRSSVFGHRPELDEAFIVLNANRNSPRKRIDITLQGFAEFSAGKPNAFLYLHMGMKDVGCDVLALASDLGIRNRLLTSTLASEQPRVADDHLNAIYNACDVGLNTSTGEGWGLVAFEHGATGAAQIMPSQPSCVELWKDRALLIEIDDEGVVAPSAVADALRRLYSDESSRDALVVAAYELATEPRFSWDRVAAQWRELLMEVISAPPGSRLFQAGAGGTR
jgi:D-inositol-3-phosphate glycosyltransferase